MLLIDKFAYTNELRDVNPQAKILYACGGLLILRVIDSNILYLINILIALIITVLIAKIPLKNYVELFRIPLFFLVMSLIMVMVSINDSDYLLYLTIKNTKIGINKESIYQSIHLFITVISSLSSIYFMILTTSINQIIRVLQKIKFPNLFIELMVIIYRSIFIFLEEMKNISLSQELKFGYEDRSKSLKSLSLLISNLLLKIISKQKDMTLALECKLYDGEFKLGE